MSLDGRIAGPDDSLDWLGSSSERGTDTSVPATHDTFLGYDEFVADIGAMLMGRRTFDVVAGFDEWPYGEAPVVVATHRELTAAPDTVTAAAGSPAELVAAARERAGEGDVYADGGRIVSLLLDAGLLDELTTTILPTVRGPGVGLFDGLGGPHDLDVARVATNAAGHVQLTWLPRDG